MHRVTLSRLLAVALALTLNACAGGGGEINHGPASAPAAHNSPSGTAATAVTTDVSAEGVKAPPAEVVRASAAAVELRAGGRAEAEVRLEIAEGYHVNANPPTHKYLIPTQLDVAPEAGLTFGQPAYPAALTRKFEFDQQPLAVYEGEVSIRLPVRAARDAAPGGRALRAKVRAQPCDDRACYPPRTVETAIRLTVR